MSIGLWILNAAGEPEPCDDTIKWARWFQEHDRRVALDLVDEVRVSTVFIGIEALNEGPLPWLFETMIYGGPHDQYQEQYATRDEALAGHARALALCRCGAGCGGGGSKDDLELLLRIALDHPLRLSQINPGEWRLDFGGPAQSLILPLDHSTGLPLLTDEARAALRSGLSTEAPRRSPADGGGS